mmetsp:Transcript_37866/g.121833  ORF Transcript_37866/g.121833 Transcript_37866/m.121833 type:complete len:204 (+) Transcript_37866:114-725(+)
MGLAGPLCCYLRSPAPATKAGTRPYSRGPPPSPWPPPPTPPPHPPRAASQPSAPPPPRCCEAALPPAARPPLVPRPPLGVRSLRRSPRRSASPGGWGRWAPGPGRRRAVSGSGAPSLIAYTRERPPSAPRRLRSRGWREGRGDAATGSRRRLQPSPRSAAPSSPWTSIGRAPDSRPPPAVAAPSPSRLPGRPPETPWPTSLGR